MKVRPTRMRPSALKKTWQRLPQHRRFHEHLLRRRVIAWSKGSCSTPPRPLSFRDSPDLNELRRDRVSVQISPEPPRTETRPRLGSESERPLHALASRLRSPACISRAISCIHISPDLHELRRDRVSVQKASADRPRPLRGHSLQVVNVGYKS